MKMVDNETEKFCCFSFFLVSFVAATKIKLKIFSSAKLRRSEEEKKPFDNHSPHSFCHEPYLNEKN